MELLARLRYLNLMPLHAYFQAKEERLLVYDYFPNGSLFSLIHGTYHRRLAHRRHSAGVKRIGQRQNFGDEALRQRGEIRVGGGGGSSAVLSSAELVAFWERFLPAVDLVLGMDFRGGEPRFAEGEGGERERGGHVGGEGRRGKRKKNKFWV